MAVEDLVTSFLSPSEQVKVVLETLVSQGPNSDGAEPIDPRFSVQDTRILAVVSHIDEWNLSEEGCVFVCRYKHPKNGPPKDLHIQRSFPIFGQFSISMAQTKRMTLDLRPDAAQPVMGQSRTGFTVTIHDDNSPLTFFTHDVKKLQLFVQECKRLKEVFDSPEKAKKSQLTMEFQWLAPYMDELSSLSELLSDIPIDLHIASESLLSRLSPCSAGLPGDDVADLRLVRNFWVRTKAQELSLKGTYNLSVRIGTFNVNGKLPSQDLSTWVGGKAFPATESQFSLLNPYEDKTLEDNAMDPPSYASVEDKPSTPTLFPSGDRSNDLDSGPDLLVLGFQELDHSAEAYIYSANIAREEAWCTAVSAALGERGPQYEKLISRQLVGMLIVIFVRKSIKSYFTDVKTCAAGAGLMGVVGNKGATAVRLTFTPKPEKQMGVKSPNPTILTFVNAHLAAFDEMVDRRNVDFHELSRRLIFETGTGQSEETVEEDIDTTVPWLGLFNTDGLFWLGDLNYRIDRLDNDIREISLSEEWDNKYELLREHDQLIKSCNAGKAFKHFHEAQIRFPPTYRFTPGIRTDSYNMKRKPAWTDRVLSFPGPSAKIRQLSYTSHPQITMSDHRPVSADFEINVGFWDVEEYEFLIRKLMSETRHMEEALGRSSLKVLTPSVDFGKVHYKRPSVRNVKMQNTSNLPAAYRFIPIHGEASIHPPWLRIEPLTGMLLPNAIAEVTFTVFVDNSTAPKLNLAEKALKSTVILHSMLGKDHFISITGEYQYTCFATTLSRLTRLTGPARTLELPHDYLPDGYAKNAPREVMRLVNWMMTGSARIDDLFLVPADEVYIHTIRECLDTGDEFPYPPGSEDDRVHLAFGATLLLFFKSLTSPVVPTILHERCLQATNRDEAFELMDAFPTSSVNTWISVTAFLHYVCRSSQDPVFRAKRLAAIFAPILMHEDRANDNVPVSIVGKRKFLLYFID